MAWIANYFLLNYHIYIILVGIEPTRKQPCTGNNHFTDN